MKKRTTLISIVLIVTLMTGAAFAWGPGKGQRGGCQQNQECQQYNNRGGFKNLTQDQKDQVKILRQQFIDDTYETRAAASAKMQEIKMIMETSEPDRNKLVKLSKEVLELKESMIEKKIDFGLALKKIAPELNGRMGFGFGKRHGRGGRGMMQGDGLSAL